VADVAWLAGGPCRVSMVVADDIVTSHARTGGSLAGPSAAFT